jgi:DnaJ-class molecular chaperone
MKDYYDILGVQAEAEPAEIKAAFRQQVQAWHPDVNQSPEAAERLRALVEAYEVLSVPEYRAAYDAARRASEPFPLPAALQQSKWFRAFRTGITTFAREVQENYLNDPAFRQEWEQSVRLGRTLARAARLLRLIR